MKTIKFGPRVLWRTLTAVFGIVLAASVGGTAVTSTWSGYLNRMLGITNTKIVTEELSEEEIEASYRYKSKFDTWQEARDYARGVTEELQAEGTVLLTNKNSALPIAKSSKITVFGAASAAPIYGSSGSGGITPTAARQIDLYEALEAEFGASNINSDMKSYYSGKSNPGKTARTLPNEPVDFIGSHNYDSFNDVAIFIFSRTGSEGSDLITTPAATGNTETNRYLQLSSTEKQVLEHIKTSNFKKRIVLVNTFNVMELGWLDDYNIDACLYIGGPGETGMKAVAEILSGTVNPSGKTTDTYAYHSFSSPAMMNFGGFTYTNGRADLNNSSTLQNYLMYSEGIYVGYRYYETRYEDEVLGQGNATANTGVWTGNSSWSYKNEVQFAFGHGLSYSNFTQKLDSVNVNWSNKTATVKVTVSNAAGAPAGKDVVEVYAQAPYTKGGVEKSAVQLVGFAKTGLIEGGKSETVTVTVELRDLASYDYEEYKTYILEQGDYYFAIGNGAHEALNNILAKKGVSSEQKARMTGEGNADKAYKATKSSFNKDEYRYSPTNYAITNQFDSADINYYQDGAVTYLSRSDWNGTYPVTVSSFTATEEMVKELKSYTSTGTGATPDAYTPGDTDTSAFKTGAENGYNLALVIGADYDDPAWDLLLDQLTLDDYGASTQQGRVEIKAVGLRATTAVDGPAAWTKSNYINDWKDVNSGSAGEATVLYPTNTIVGATWNVELGEKMGDSIGEEALWSGNTGWYGPGANTHRTPYAGRNFEYFSEDGFVAGKVCEGVVHGAIAKGTICYLKHFFTNDQETNRIGVCTFSNEQALREIYLRAFQYSFETTGEDDPSCNGVMGAFNRIGLIWSGHHYNLWRNVMEGEFGFRGNVTTDFGQNPTGLMVPQIAYEAGTTMFCTSGTSFKQYIQPLLSTDAKLFGLVREAVHRNLYNLAHSNATNGLTSASKVVRIRTWYENALLATTIISATVFAASALIVLYQSFIDKKED